MTLYDFIVCAIHRLTVYVEWINIINYKKGENFSILRNEYTGEWDCDTDFISRYRILHIITETDTSEENNEDSIILNIIVEEMEIEE